jgi:hypothetical protein
MCLSMLPIVPQHHGPPIIPKKKISTSLVIVLSILLAFHCLSLFSKFSQNYNCFLIILSLFLLFLVILLLFYQFFNFSQHICVVFNNFWALIGHPPTTKAILNPRFTNNVLHIPRGSQGCPSKRNACNLDCELIFS